MSPTVRVAEDCAWIDPLAVATGLSTRAGALCLLSDGGSNGRFSYVACEPERLVSGPMPEADLFCPFEALDAAGFVVGLAAYDAGARAATGERGPSAGDWPDLILAVYPSMLVFDHQAYRVTAVGLGESEPLAQAAANRAMQWMQAALAPPHALPPARSLEAEQPDQIYLDAVADVVARIEAGELFQANIARAWRGALEPGADPFAVFTRLAQGAAPYGAFWRVDERVLVSNSPELFLTFDPSGRRIETRPIKGTRPRSADAAQDAANAAELLASAKDRAENLMIVDLMRNDLARVSTPGSVLVEKLFALESFTTVHHLVSTVASQAAPGVAVADVLTATFPPGSITGAPKHQAMRVIAGHEPPRGPWCGTLILQDAAGALTASVLIRTIGFWREEGEWRFRTLAGAGIVADSDPESELAETDAKIAAIRTALIG